MPHKLRFHKDQGLFYVTRDVTPRVENDEFDIQSPRVLHARLPLLRGKHRYFRVPRYVT